MSQAYSSVSAPSGLSISLNMAWPLNWRPVRSRLPCRRCWSLSHRSSWSRDVSRTGDSSS